MLLYGSLRGIEVNANGENFMINEKNKILQEVFLKELGNMHQNFDPKENLLMTPPSTEPAKKNYHSAIGNNRVHLISNSMEYAVGLLYSSDPVNRERGLAITDRILTLQDTDENSPTYGIWSYYTEEPFDKMKAPDWNWADFLSKVLIQILIDHKDILPGKLLKRVEISISHAAKSIMRRNMGPDYTNISLMGSFVTIKAGELLKNDELFNYGKRRLMKELKFVKANGGYTEYNSPTYSILALEEIGRMLKYFNDNECLETASELGDIEWSCIAHHYHPATKQLSAPHSRCYTNLAEKKMLSFIHMGTGMSLNLIENSQLQIGLLWNELEIKCPEKYYEYFEPITKPRLFREKFYKGVDIISEDEIRVLVEKGIPDMEGTTYMNQYFSLGTFTRFDLWNQRRPLMAYWGTPEKCSYIRLRCLHDGQDYSSAMLLTSQVQNHVVGGVYFVKDHGDFHFILDPLKDGKIKAQNLSLRFEIGGYTEDVHIPENISFGTAFDIKTDSVDIRINPMFCAFGGETPIISTGKDDSSCWVDITLYNGEEKVFDFNELNSTAFVFGLSIFDRKICVDDGSYYAYEPDMKNRTVKAELIGAETPADIKIPLDPSYYIEKPTVGQVKKVKCGGFLYEKK
jgi:hypothetical protein